MSRDLYAQTEAWLRAYPRWQKAVVNLEGLYKLRQETEISAVATSDISGGKTNKVHSNVEDIVLNLEEITERKCQIEAKIRLVESALELLDARQRRIIEMRYFDRFSWWLIEATMSLSDRQCRNIRTEAVHIVKEGIFGEED
jgi:RinA family phage transcriptional activator